MIYDNLSHNSVFEMFSYLTKFFLKNTGLNLRDSQEKLLLDIAENKLLAYIFIGAFAASLDIGIFVFLSEWIGIKPLICHSISVPVSAIFSFSVNAYLNFKKTDLLLSRFFSFSTVICTGYLLGLLIIFVIDNVLQLGGTIGKLTSLPFVVTLQFYLNSKITFKD
jgi:putative flippase GtrA